MSEITFLGFIFLVTWIVIGWRAMKAHEALATEARRANDRLHDADIREGELSLRNQKVALRNQKKLYQSFLRDRPEVDELSSKERHQEFRDWLIEQ